MTVWTFGLTTEGWSGTSFTHTGADGSPNAGCLTRVGTPTFATGFVSITGLNIPISSADVFSFYVKYTGTLNAIDGVIGFTLRDSGGNSLGGIAGTTANITSAGVWFNLTNSGATAGVVVSIEINITGTNAFTALFFDTVRVREGPPPEPPDPLRFLGMAADNTNLYVTCISGGTADPTGGTISLLQYPLDDLTNPGLISSFGTANYADPDTFVRGLYPVMRPDREGIIYLRGRDGGGTATQLYYRDFSGTLGWDDASPGTATWGTAKFAVALMPWPITPSWVMVAFSDDDVYESRFHGTANWTKKGDATGGIRCAARSDFEGNKLLLGGTAAGTVLFTQNEGVSFTSGGTAAGTINAFEWSYPNS